MLQPYDWNEPINYYRLTQKSFAVVVPKLDTLHYSGKLAKFKAEDFARKMAISRAKESTTKAAKLHAEAMRLLDVKEALSASRHDENYVAAKAAALNAELMKSAASPPPILSKSDQQIERADPRASFAAIDPKVIRAKSKSSASLGMTKAFISAALLTAALSWAQPVWGKWLVKSFVKTIIQKWMVAFALCWKVGTLVATGVKMLGNAVAARAGRFVGSAWCALIKGAVDSSQRAHG